MAQSVKLELVLTQSSQSVANNSSVVKWSVYLTPTRSVSASMTASAVVNGSTVWSESGFNPGYLNYNQRYLMKSGTITVPHNSNGTKTVSGSARLRTNTTGTTWAFDASTTASRTLSTTARVSTVSLYNPTTPGSNEFTIGKPVKVNISAKSSSFRHKITLAWGSLTKTIATGVTSTYTFTPDPNELGPIIPHVMRGQGTIWVETFNGSTSVGKSSVKYYGTLPAYSPQVSGLTVADNSLSGTLTGKHFTDVGWLDVDWSALSSSYGATPTLYIKHLGSEQNVSSTKKFSFNAAGSGALVGVVRDSRGRESTVTLDSSLAVEQYRKPSISTLELFRSDASGRKDTLGTGVYGTFAARVQSAQNAAGEDVNQGHVTLRFEAHDSSESFTVSDSIPVFYDSTSLTKLYTMGVKVETGWTVTAILTDTFGGTVSRQVSILRGQVALSIGPDGIAVGKPFDTSNLHKLQVGGDVHIEGGITVGGRSYTEAEVRDALGTRDNTIMINGTAYPASGVVDSPGWTVARTDGNIYSGSMGVSQPFAPPAGWTFNWTIQQTTGYTFLSVANQVPVGGIQILRVMQVGSASTTALSGLAWQLTKL